MVENNQPTDLNLEHTMINTKRKSSVVLVGLFMLPTSSKYHMHEPKRSGAFKEGQDVFLLESTDPEDLKGGPRTVVVTADEGTLYWELGQDVKTQHAQVRKNLPARRVVAILRADGTVEGTLPPKGMSFPHWSFIPANEDGSASLATINEVEARMVSNKTARERQVQELREMKAKAKAGSKAA